MSLPFKHLYEFGEFRLDVKEKILMHGDRPVELTPKGFELLSVFVENHGRLLEKDELMTRVWADSFVEESNLTFNIRQLRKALDDDAHDPKYIKTVRRHGYRFIADVRQISAEPSAEAKNGRRDDAPPIFRTADPAPDRAAAGQPTTNPENLRARRKLLSPVFLVAAILPIAAIVIGLWYVSRKGSEPHALVLATAFNSEKLSTNGRVVFAVLSPDGKDVIYTNGAITDRQSIWLRQLENGNSVEIIPPADEVYFGLALSPDGKTLYFVRRPRRTAGEPMSVYRVSIFGGIPEKIINRTEGWISLSPDGTRISFVRCPHGEDEFCSLWVADAADGQNERKILSRPRPIRIGDNKFAPDGKTIVFAVGQSANAANEFGLSEVDPESGAEREFSGERFFNVKNMAWLPDKSGLLITASRIPNKNFRIWQVSAATGTAVALTKDSESYSIMALDKAAAQIVTTQVRQDFHLRLLNLENPAAVRALGDAASVNFAPDGKIYFASIMSGNDEIWSINPDGSGQRQLTNNAADESVPVVSPDNKTVFFVSNKTGAAQVWRMNTDGSNQKQITQKDGGSPFFVSPDGEWVYYRQSLTSKLGRVSTKTGEEQLVIDKPRGYFAVSPDGAQVAFSERQGDERYLTVAALADGQSVKAFRLADPKALLLNIVWMPDRRNLAYVSADRELGNNILWLQSLDGGAPQQIAALGDEEIGGFGLAVSPDGKTFTIAQGRWLHDAVLFKGLR
jgi:Tol biopolymer transport system component/DNA-binding winged helix-turn-helix (wHTH) protein